MVSGGENLLVQTGSDNQSALSLYRAMSFEDYDITLQKSLKKGILNKKSIYNGLVFFIFSEPIIGAT
jgi:hypothetical protein